MIAVVKRLFVLLVVIGVILAVWRYVGGGIGIGQPGWLEAAFTNVQSWTSSAAAWISGLFD